MSKNFSKIDAEMTAFAAANEGTAAFRRIEPWAKAESTQAARAERVARARESFWDFENTYFSPELYSDGFSEPAPFHLDLLEFATTPGVWVVPAARKHGKTAYAKKIFVWLLLSGRVTFAGTLSETLQTSRNILQDIYFLIEQNERLKFDFRPKFSEANTEQLTFQLPETRTTCRVMAFSEGRSVRGASRLFDRPQFLLCDDLETRQSALGRDQAEERIRILREAYQSMSSGGTLLVLANNFDERCAINILVQEQSDGILPEKWHVRAYPAWDDNRPLWPSRFPAADEAELRRMLGVADEAEWLAEFQQTPTPPAGFIFQRLAPLPFYDDLPPDARGTVYCDPNLAKKARGDTTGACALLYSPTTDLYYLDAPVCRSFADANVLLDAIFGIVDHRTRALGWDGHVGQESMWSQHVRNYCRIRSRVVPRIEYMRINVDEFAKSVQSEWNEGRILLSRKFETPEGVRFLNQLFAFTGKKSNKKDDAPDSLICNYVLLHNRHLGRRARSVRRSSTVNDFYSF